MCRARANANQVRHLEAIMRIAESFCKMRLSEYCSAQDIDRAIAVTVDSFIGSQKVSCKKALSRAFAKYTLSRPKPQSKRRAGIPVSKSYMPHASSAAH